MGSESRAQEDEVLGDEYAPTMVAYGSVLWRLMCDIGAHIKVARSSSAGPRTDYDDTIPWLTRRSCRSHGTESWQ